VAGEAVVSAELAAYSPYLLVAAWRLAKPWRIGDFATYGAGSGVLPAGSRIDVD